MPIAIINTQLQNWLCNFASIIKQDAQYQFKIYEDKLKEIETLKARFETETQVTLQQLQETYKQLKIACPNIILSDFANKTLKNNTDQNK